MMFLIGCINSSSFYAVIILILGLLLKGKIDTNSFVFYVACAYPIVLIINIIILRIRRRIENKKIPFFMADDLAVNNSLITDLFQQIFNGFLNPFRHTWIFILVITRKHIIRDKNEFYNALDFLEVIFGFVSTTLFIIIMAIVYLK